MSKASSGRTDSGRADDGPAKDAAPKRRGTKFVPVEDVRGPGLSPRSRELLALALAFVALYGMLCLGTFRLADPDGPIPSGGGANLGGAVGYYLALGFTFTLGYAGWVPFVLLLAGAVALFVGRVVDRLVVKAIGAVGFAAMLAILLAGEDGRSLGSLMTPFGAGGNFGHVVSPKLFAAFGGSGRLLLVGFGTVVAFVIATEWLFSQLVLRVLGLFEHGWRRMRGQAVVPAVAEGAVEGLSDDESVAAGRAPRRRRSATATAAESGTRGGPVDSEEPDAEAPAEVEERPEAAAEAPAAGETPRRSRRRGRAEEVGSDAAALDRSEPSGAREPDEEDAEAPEAPRAKADAKPAEPVAVPEPEPEPAAPAPIVVLQPAPKPKPKPQKPKPKAKKAGQSNLPFDDVYPFPPIELFQEAIHTDLGATAEVLNRGGQAIVQKLANFGIESVVETASVGPAVTQYELRVADSVRVNKVTGFEADLAAVLKAVSVRVVAPIPGKDTIGIEVPNPKRQKVFMRDLLEQFGRAEDLALPLFLGKDVAGNPIVEDLARMPHLLIAGTTGSGKSVCINTILLSILMSRTPQQVKLILVDPKMVELQAYKRVPHLCCDVVTNMKKAPSVLQWAVDEMENRYALFSVAGVNHIRNYNRLGQQELEKRLKREPDPDRVTLPYIVIVIDEFADLMNVAQNEVEELIQRLAQKSRAVGMHVILATQRPSSEVITGIIKANLPCQIAFKVNRKIDSRVILDANGAEKLLGFGDMLYMPPGGGAMLRAQGTFVADDELQAVVQYLEEHGQEPDFNPALVQTQSSSRPSIADRDDRYREAVEVVLGQQRGSATLLQRALAVGYTRATRLLELMEEDGLVGAFVGSKSRDVLMTLEEWQAREAAMAEELARLDAEAEAGAEGGEDGEEAPGADSDTGGEAVPRGGDDGDPASGAEAEPDDSQAEEGASAEDGGGDGETPDDEPVGDGRGGAASAEV